MDNDFNQISAVVKSSFFYVRYLVKVEHFYQNTTR